MVVDEPCIEQAIGEEDPQPCAAARACRVAETRRAQRRNRMPSLSLGR